VPFGVGQTAEVPTPEPLDEWQARMGREDAERPARPQGADRLRSAAAASVGAGTSALIVQLVLGRTTGVVLVGLVAAAALLGFVVRYLANPRPLRDPWK
jgi:hypothetical protein